MGFKRSNFLAFFVLLLWFTGCSSVRTRVVDPITVYTVREGDSIGGISSRFQVSESELLNLNKGLNPQSLKPGIRLHMPPRLLKSEPSYASTFQDSYGFRSGFIGALSWPIKNEKGLSSQFGSRWRSFHEGIDLTAKSGTPIYAAHSGLVVYSDNRRRGFGNMVIIKAEGLVTIYAHNRRNLVKRGERVARGELIAEVGQTGRATGPHLHFETRIKTPQGRYIAVNPLIFYPL